MTDKTEEEDVEEIEDEEEGGEEPEDVIVPLEERQVFPPTHIPSGGLDHIEFDYEMRDRRQLVASHL